MSPPADWDAVAAWWVDEVASDPAYRLDVIPLALRLVGSGPTPVLDLGCGEGQLLRSLPLRPAIGCDAAQSLLSRAVDHAPVVRCRLPDLQWLRSASVGSAVAVMVLEHLADHDALFAAAARVVRAGGALVVVMNHPAYTAPGAGPIIDQTDGEVLWRWGPYLERAVSTVPAGDARVAFHHRPLGDLLTSAANRGWRLDRMIERGLHPGVVAAIPGLEGQQHIPRLLGVRWIRVDSRIEPPPPMLSGESTPGGSRL